MAARPGRVTVRGLGGFPGLQPPAGSCACTKRGLAYLHVTTTAAGTGIPGYTG